MISVEEFIEKRPMAAWMNAQDVFKYVLENNDKQKTVYKNENRNYRESDYRPGLEKAMNNPPEINPADFDQLEHEAFEGHQKPKTREIVSEYGELNIDRYLEGHERPFDEPVKIPQDTPSVTIFFDANVPRAYRRDSYMKERQRKAYKLVLEAEAKGIPCRVVTCRSVSCPENRQIMRLYFIIKDYEDPIFEGIWSAYQDNYSTWCFNCLMALTLIGTRSSGLMRMHNWNISEDIDLDMEKVILMDSRFLSK